MSTSLPTPAAFINIDLPSVAGYLFQLVVDNWILWPILLILAYALPAPYLAFRLLRRNRSLGRDIYREVAQADRFMDIWMTKKPQLSNLKQYHQAFVFNGNSAAAHNAQIDEQLAKWKLVKRSPTHGTFNGSGAVVQSVHGRFWLRNWLVFLLLLFMRITFFGDKVSHIAIGGGLFTEKQLKRMYWETTLLLVVLLVFLLTLLHFI